MFRTTNGGWSYWIPGPVPDGFDGCDGFDKNPRIFFTLQSARNALTAWLRGLQREKKHYTHIFDGPDEYAELIVEAPPLERKREDMAIVELELVGV